MKRSFPEKRILVVEDERLMRNLLVQMLHKIGFKEVQSEESAELVLNNPEYMKTDLLITDVEMEKISGLELVKKIRNDQTVFSKELPVIILTGLSQMRVLMDAVELKIQGFLSKPVSEKILLSKVEDVLSKSGQLVYRDINQVFTNNRSDNETDEGNEINAPLSIEKDSTEFQDKQANIKNVLVRLNDLAVGMILAEDIAARGSIILRAGKKIEQGHIQVLRDLEAFIEKKEILVSLIKQMK